MSTAIRVENLSKTYRIAAGGRGGAAATLRETLTDLARGLLRPRAAGAVEEFRALDDVSFEVEQGQRLGIIGKNGAGKSTLLKVLSRITEPTRGRISLRGRVASLLEVGTGFHPELTGRENVFLSGAVLGMSRREIGRKFDEIVAFAEVERFLDTPVKRYSSGMYMRLAFAVAAHLEPDILLVDEVLAVGDAEFQRKCLGKMDEVGKQGRTVIFVSHNTGSIRVLCERALLLREGRVALLDDTQKVIACYQHSDRERKATVRIEPSMRNRGGERVRLLECSLRDPAGEPQSSFLVGEDLRIELLVESEYSGPMSFWVIIFDALGKPLVSSHQRDRELVPMTPGRHRVAWQTSQLGLLPDTYTVSAGAFDPRLQFLDWVDGCQSFEVLPCFRSGQAFDGRWGAVDHPGRWQVEPVPGVAGAPDTMPGA